MRSGQPLLVPLIVVPLVAAGVVLGARHLRPWLLRRRRGGATLGAALLAAGVVMLLLYPVAGDWPYYPLVTPVVLAVGAMVAAYTLGLSHAPVPARVALWLVVAAGVFWANATVAQWSGAGLAREQGAHLEVLPQVVVDTKERLYLRSPDISESALPSAEGQQFAFRYRGWRLLIQKGDRMFLVPCRASGSSCVWIPGSPTILLRPSDAARLQFFAP
jgi:hypothetical protein